jgi:hypothetical protein
MRIGNSLAAIVFASVLGTGSAHALIQGSPSELSRHTVRIISKSGTPICSGVAVGPRHVATARHCLARARSVSADGKQIRITGSARAAAGIAVRGDAIVLTLAESLPSTITPLVVGDGDGPFVIAGYGTDVESTRALGAVLHEATVVAAGGNALVDPNRSGLLSPSACYGDSGGPVVRRVGGSYVLVGVISRASHVSPRLVCGQFTHFAPVHASGQVLAAREETPRARKVRHHRQVRR